VRRWQQQQAAAKAATSAAAVAVAIAAVAAALSWLLLLGPRNQFVVVSQPVQFSSVFAEDIKAENQQTEENPSKAKATPAANWSSNSNKAAAGATAAATQQQQQAVQSRHS